MKTITLTEETYAILLTMSAAGAMAIEQNAQHNISDCMNMLRMKKRGRYPSREDKETILKNFEASEKAVKRAIATFKFIKENDLIADDPNQKQAVEDIIARDEKFLAEGLVECKTEFDEVFALMENPDYNPEDYLKPETEQEEVKERLHNLMEMLGRDPDEVPETKPEDPETPEASQQDPEDNQ